MCYHISSCRAYMHGARYKQLSQLHFVATDIISGMFCSIRSIITAALSLAIDASRDLWVGVAAVPPLGYTPPSPVVRIRRPLLSGIHVGTTQILCLFLRAGEDRASPENASIYPPHLKPTTSRAGENGGRKGNLRDGAACTRCIVG